MAKAVKLTKEQIEKLKAIGITGCKTTEDSRAQMVEKMEELGIEDDGESWDDVYDIVSTLLDDPEAENDDLAEEVAASDKKSKSKKKVEEEEEDEDDEEEEDEDEDEDDDSEEDEDEDSDDEEEDEEKPTKKAGKKSEPKASDKKSATSNKKDSGKKKEEPAKEEKKSAAKTSDKKAPAAKTTSTGKTSKRLNPKENEEDAKLYDGLKKALSKLGEFEFNFIANGGVSIKYLGENSTKVLFSFDSPKLVDKKVIGRVYSSAVKTEEELIALFGEDFEIKQDWSGIPIMSDINLDEIIEAIKENKAEFETFLKKLKGKDTKLGKNREKMEESLKESQKDKAVEIKNKKKAAAKEEPAPEPTKKAKKKVVEEEEEEEEKPAKKSAKKSDKKKK